MLFANITNCILANHLIVLIFSFYMYLIFTHYIERLYTCKNGTDGQGKTIQFANYTNFNENDIVVFFSKYLILCLPFQRNPVFIERLFCII